MSKSKAIPTILSILLAFSVVANSFSLNIAKAAGNLVFTSNSTAVTVEASNINPIDYIEIKAGAGNAFPDDPAGLTATARVLQASTVYMYTPSYFYTHSQTRAGATDYVVEVSEDGDKIIEKKTGGGAYIPVPGYVISVPDSSGISFAVGATFTRNAEAANYAIATMAVETTSRTQNTRTVVDKLNTSRSQTGTVYYDYAFGQTHTATNQFGTEMAVALNEGTGKFEVSAFRPFRDGSQNGITIPDNGFALSGYSTGTDFDNPARTYYFEGVKFDLGDEVVMKGFDYVRVSGTYTYAYNFINPTQQTNPQATEFPELRGDNQLNIYTYDVWGSKISTNVYGYEAAVDANNTVVKRGVNVNDIPEGGYVLSGHGNGRDFIRAYVVLGSRITINEGSKTIRVEVTMDSFFAGAKGDFDAAIVTAQTAKEFLFDIDNTTIEQAKQQGEIAVGEVQQIIDQMNAPDFDQDQKQAKLIAFQQGLNKINACTNAILAASAESNVISARAAWHRPTERNLSEIQQTLQKCADNNINLLFVETLWWGYSMFESQYFDDHPDFQGYDYTGGGAKPQYTDYLKAFAKEAQAYGVEVHAWVEVFFIGINASHPLMAQKPDWILTNSDGTQVQKNEGGTYYFLDPANLEVQAHLLDYFDELLTQNPDIKGLNLDYIRYPVSSRSEDTGYNTASITRFGQEMGYSCTSRASLNNLLNPERTTNADQIYADWKEWRAQQVSNFVKSVSQKVRADHNDILLSTAVFPGLTESKDTKMQDWPTWLKAGWIDIATPMAYYDNPADVMQRVSEMIRIVDNISYNYAGLAISYRGLQPIQNLYHIQAAYEGMANGYVIFDTKYLLPLDEVTEILQSGLNAKAAVLPHDQTSKILATMFDDVLAKTAIYMGADRMTQAQKNTLNAEFERIKALPDDTAEDLAAIIEAINDIAKNKYDYALGHAANRISDNMSYLATVLDIKISRLLINSGEWDPSTTPLRPDKTPANNGGDDGDDDDDDDWFGDRTPSNDDKNLSSGQIAAIAGGSAGGAVLIAGGVVIALLLIKKRKKQA